MKSTLETIFLVGALIVICVDDFLISPRFIRDLIVSCNRRAAWLQNS